MKAQQSDYLFVKMVRDLEDTREDHRGYSYVRTMRNILIGKKDAEIAPLFEGKPYYGIFSDLSLEAMEQIMDAFVQLGQLEVEYTNHGKLYCTPEYYSRICRR